MSSGLTVARRLAHFVRLSQDDIADLGSAIVRVRTAERGEQLVAECERPDHVNLVLRGYVGRYKMLSDGRRQITSVYLDGDVFDLRMFVLDRMDHSITALATSEIGFIPRQHLEELTTKRPALARAFWAATLVNESILTEWLVNVGRRSPRERFAHLMCEFYARLEAVGSVDKPPLVAPFTQSMVADMLAISPVHASRALGGLVRRGLISWRHNSVAIVDIAALQEIARFDASYLHLGPPASFDG